MKKITYLSIIILSLLLSGCTSSQQQETASLASLNDKINVVVTFYPLYEFATAVGGESINAVLLIPQGVEPHEWEPSPSDIKKMIAADVFVYNGAGFEGWIEKALELLDKERTVVVEASKNSAIKRAGVRDPHVWLDPLRAISEVEEIRDALKVKDPKSAARYDFNAKKFIDQLLLLDEEFKIGLASCTKRELVTAHEAFGYLAQRYDLKEIPIAGLSPEEEPTPKQLANIIDQIKEKGISTIFVEAEVSPKSAQAIAQDTNAKIDVLYTLETNTHERLRSVAYAQGESYLFLMKENLNKIKKALMCTE